MPIIATDMLTLCRTHADLMLRSARAHKEFSYELERGEWDPESYGDCIAAHAPATVRVLVDQRMGGLPAHKAPPVKRILTPCYCDSAYHPKGC